MSHRLPRARPTRRDLGEGVPVVDAVAVVDRIGPGAADPAHGTVVVLDDEGGWAAASLAEALARQGCRVHLVSPTASLAARITTYSKLALVPRLRELGVRAHLLRTAAVTGPGRVTLTDTLSGDTTELEDVALVVDVGLPAAADELYRALDAADGGPRVHLVGDANAPRTATEAVYEGRIAGAFVGREETPEARLVRLTY